MAQDKQHNVNAELEDLRKTTAELLEQYGPLATRLLAYKCNELEKRVADCESRLSKAAAIVKQLQQASES